MNHLYAQFDRVKKQEYTGDTKNNNYVCRTSCALSHLYESGFYYLQSRYYDPQIGRFINADNCASTGQSFAGCNMFLYCLNNPVNLIDSDGRYAAINLNVADSGHINQNRIKRIPTSVKYDVPLYNQGQTRLCWAYCMLMRESYKTGETMTKESANLAAKRLGYKYNGPFWNAGLLFFRLGSKRRITDIETLHNYLNNYGPLYAAYSNKSNAFDGHIVLVTGVDLEAGLVYSNNPWNVQGPQTYDDFIRGFLDTNQETVTGYHLKGIYIPWCN